MKQLKQISTYQIWQHHKAYLEKHYWKRKIILSDGYFACSIGQVSQDIIELYSKPRLEEEDAVYPYT